MLSHLHRRAVTWPGVTLLCVAILAMAGCGTRNQPPVPPALPTATPTAERTAAPAVGDEATPAMATVTIPGLRVRQAPSETSAVTAGIRQGESYPVVGISTDGEWLQLAIPQAAEGRGWVNVNLVSVAGDITGAAIVDPQTVQASPLAGPSSPIPTPAAGYAVVVTEGSRLRVRTEPTADAPIAGYVYPGESYRVLERTADGAWVRIAGAAPGVASDNRDGGWVAAEFVQMNR